MLFKTLLIVLIGASLCTKRVIASPEEESPEPQIDDTYLVIEEPSYDTPSEDYDHLVYDEEIYYEPNHDNDWDNKDYDHSIQIEEYHYTDGPYAETYEILPEEGHDNEEVYKKKNVKDNEDYDHSIQIEEYHYDDTPFEETDYEILPEEGHDNEEVYKKKNVKDKEHIDNTKPEKENGNVDNESDKETADEEIKTDQEIDDSEESSDPQTDEQVADEETGNDEIKTGQETDNSEETDDDEDINEETSEEEIETEQGSDYSVELSDPRTDEYVVEEETDNDDIKIEQETDNSEVLSDPRTDEDVDDEETDDNEIKTEQEINESGELQTNNDSVNEEASDEEDKIENDDNSEQQNDIESEPSLICPEGWFLYEESSTCYYISSSSQNWNDSQNLCINLEGSLASFHSTEETKFVEGRLNNSVWIGLIDNKEKGVFQWSDKTAFDFKNWAEGEPSVRMKVPLFSSFFGRENCVEMKKSKLFKWNDETCSSYRQALCSRKPELIPRTECPVGWFSDGSGTCYKLSSVKADYETAVEFCSLSAVGAALVAPLSEAQNKFIATALREKGIKSIWIGIDDREQEDEFRNVDKSIQEYFNWEKSQPSEFFFFDEDCVEMYQNGKWNDEDCDHAYNFVCTLQLSIF